MPQDTPPRPSDAWHSLERHARELAPVALGSLFDGAPGRAEDFAADACGLHLDYSKQRLTGVTRRLLLDLSRAVDVAGARERLFAGEAVNTTEQRAAWHVALRWPAGEPLPGAAARRVPEDVFAVRERMREISDAVRDGRWTGHSGAPIRDVVNIGIGGSDLGPAMVCRALDARAAPQLCCHFVSNLDSNHLASVLQDCTPAQTLFVICSKTFSTQETLVNARSAREWLLADAGDSSAAVARHFVAVSSAVGRCAEFGIPASNVFGFQDWVGGRYSLWSPIGLSIALYLGMDDFEALLAGGHAMDRHFLDAAPERNLPLLLGLVGIWNRNLLGMSTHAVLPYDHALELFPAFLQQLEMESNGKGVDIAGRALERAAAAVVWGTLGNNAQHAFYQMLHQGLDDVPSDIIVPVHSQRPLAGHETAVIANALAQAEALMRGRDLDEARAELRAHGHYAGLDPAALDVAAAHRVMPGNRPSSVVLYERLTPEVLGSLVALYEHKVFVQATCWGINAFDQFGVELGKKLAGSVQRLLEDGGDASGHDPSTRALVARVRRMRGRVLSDGRQLTLVRHAKSSWRFAGLDDFHRPLNKRGLRDALRMPRLLADRLPAPDRLLSSDAVRAVQTCQLVADAWSLPEHRAVLDYALYLADIEAILELLGCLDGDPTHVMLVGHNPGLTDLYNHLVDTPLDNLPTLGVAHLDLAVSSWNQVPPRAARSAKLLLPKELLRDD